MSDEKQEPEYICFQIPLAELDRSDAKLDGWIKRKTIEGFQPVTWRIQNGNAHFFMVRLPIIEVDNGN